MWKCPKCDALLVQRNLAHSCFRTTVEQFLSDKPARGVELYRHFLAECEKIGPIIQHPVKTRIAFMVEVRFAAVTRIGKDFIEGTLWLREKVSSAKFQKVADLAGNFIHRFRIHDESDVDSEFRKYIRMSYAIGERKHLKQRRRS